jgi:hypothetical protein
MKDSKIKYEDLKQACIDMLNYLNREARLKEPNKIKNKWKCNYIQKISDLVNYDKNFDENINFNDKKSRIIAFKEWLWYKLHIGL